LKFVRFPQPGGPVTE